MAIRNFFDRKLRSFLTVLAVVIGVFAIFFLLSFGLGIQSLVTKQVIGNESIKSIDVISPNSKLIKLNKETVKTIRSYPYVKQVGVQYSFPSVVSYKGSEIDAVAYGVDLQYQTLSSLNVLKGRLLESADNHSVVVNLVALKSIGISDAATAINKTIKITIPLDLANTTVKQIDDTFTIVGVVESDAGAGGELIIPSSIFDIAGVPVYNDVSVVVDSTANVATTRTKIESNGFQTTSLTDTLGEINDIFKYFNLVLVGFGSIGMIVAILGMFNSLTISLFERTKEIGLMMILGARRSDMRKLFIFEAVLISFIGSVIGVLVAIIAGRIVNWIVNISAASRGVAQSFDLFATPIWAVAAIILGTILVGIAVVYLPARRAERVNPIDALRRE
jgi:putative ABC transport system permease protein